MDTGDKDLFPPINSSSTSSELSLFPSGHTDRNRSNNLQNDESIEKNLGEQRISISSYISSKSDKINTQVTVGTADSTDSASLFPSMNHNNRNTTKDNTAIFDFHQINQLENIDRIDTSQTNNIDRISTLNRYNTRGDSCIDDNYNGNNDNDDIRSSVIHQMLDNESFDDNFNNDKIFYNKLYNKYDKSSTDKQDTEIRDFEHYTKLLEREDRLKRKIDLVAKRKAKNVGKSHQGNNVLTTLDEAELNYLFANGENPKNWDETEESNKNSKSRKPFFKNLLKSTPSPGNHHQYNYKNTNSTNSAYNEKKEYPYGDYISTFSSAPIDDDIRLEDLPIDAQPFRKIDAPRNSDIFPFDIDIVVSGDEKVDYGFHKIDLYQNIDPEEQAGWKPPNRFIKFLTVINPMRMIRIQRANKYQIQRKLNVRHLHQIALGGTLGVGLLLSSGKAFSIAGPLGCLLGFVIAGFIVISTMLSFCEIVTLIPLCGGVSGIASRFVDDAFGFALGVIYWITYTISFPSEITAGAIMLSFYHNLGIPGSRTAGWITLFFSFTLAINLFDIRVYGEFEYYSTFVKLFILIGLMIYMIVLNRGGSAPYHEKIGFKYWDSGLSNITEKITFGPFRPTFDVNDIGLGSLNGIGGHAGRFLQVLIASVIASYAYVGTEIVIIAGSESRNPRESIPSATKTIFYRIIVFYLVAIFLIGLNVYSGDPRLLRYFSGEHNSSASLTDQQNDVLAVIGGDHCDSEIVNWGGFTNGNQSPWVIAIQSAGLCSFASAVNAFLLYFALTAASSQLYVSSRTLYFMAIQNKAPNCFALCTKKGVPYMSVLFTSAFGLLSYLSVQNNTALIFERLVSVCATAGLLVWSGMCLSFIRFYYALQLRPDIISRSDDDYPYRSPFQPYLAYMGLIIGLLLVFASGFIVFLKNEWSSLFFISSYGSLFLFVFCYIFYKVLKQTKVQRLDQIDLDSGRREIDRVIWEDEKYYASNFKEILIKGINLLV